MKKLVGIFVLVFALSLLVTCVVTAATWQTVQLLNSSSHSQAKTARISAAVSGGGFHAVYKDATTSRLWYRRYTTSLGSAIDMSADLSYGNHEVCSAGNGDIWATWERWLGDGSTEQIYATRSSNGGSSWTAYQVTNAAGGGHAKNPDIQPYGASSSAEVITLNWWAGQKTTYHNRWNGSSWGGYTSGWWTDNSYAIQGSCRALNDGSVYRCYGKQNGGAWQIYYRRYNGSSWDPEVQVSQNTGSGFASRPDIAVNGAGQILVVWDVDNYVRYRFYNGSSWGSDTGLTEGWGADVTAIPNRNEFYMVHTGRPSNGWDRAYGRSFLNGTWGANDLVGNNLSGAYMPDVEITAGPDGTLYACMEFWGTGNPQQYWTKCTDFAGGPPPNPMPTYDACTMSSTTLYANDSTQYTVTLKCSDASGVNDITNMRVLFNYNLDGSQTPTRGYLGWGQTAWDITKYGETWATYSCTGGGYWGVVTSGWGAEYITAVTASTSVSGNQRTVTWTFKVKPAWGTTGPATGNFPAIWVQDTTGQNPGWQRASTLFGLTFNVSNNGTISGTVNASTGGAISGATVSTTTGGYTATTNASGGYTLSNVAAGTYSVVASHTNYNAGTNTGVVVTAGNTTTSNFSLTPKPGSISGTVTASGGGAISGATVSTTTGGYTATTNASGAYTLSNVAVGTYSVVASHTNYNTGTNTGVVVNANANTVSNFTLTPKPGSISGTVTASGGGAISGATVSTTTGGYSTTTNASGAYTLSNVTVGTYSVVASAAGYNSGTNTGVVVNPNANTVSNFTLTPSTPTNLVTNGDMEGGFSNTGWGTNCSGFTSKLPSPINPWGWNNDTSYPFNTFQETTIKYAGANSLGFAFCQTAASPGKMGIAYCNVNLGGSGISKTFTVWARHANGNCPSIMCWNPGQNQSNPSTAYSAGRYQWVTTDNWGQVNTWVTRSMTVTSDSSGYVTIMVGGAAHTGTSSGSKVYIDNVSVQ